MKLRDFIDKYSALTDDEKKAKLVDAIMTKQYCDVGIKYAVLQGMLDNSIITEDDGNKYIDMFLSKINFTIAILVLYTSLDLMNDDGQTMNAFDSYDLIMKSGAMQDIVSCIGQIEFNELADVNSSLMDTFKNKYNSLHSYVSNLAEHFANIFASLTNESIKTLNETLKDEDKVNSFKKYLEDNFLKKSE